MSGRGGFAGPRDMVVPFARTRQFYSQPGIDSPNPLPGELRLPDPLSRSRCTPFATKSSFSGYARADQSAMFTSLTGSTVKWLRRWSSTAAEVGWTNLKGSSRHPRH